DDPPLGGGPGSGVIAKVVQPLTQLVEFELAHELLRWRAAFASSIAEDGEASHRQDQSADRNLDGPVRLQLGLEVKVAPGTQLQGFERLSEVGPGLLYFPFRFSTCLAHSRSEERRVGKECRARWWPQRYMYQRV